MPFLVCLCQLKSFLHNLDMQCLETYKSASKRKISSHRKLSSFGLFNPQLMQGEHYVGGRGYKFDFRK